MGQRTCGGVLLAAGLPASSYFGGSALRKGLGLIATSKHTPLFWRNRTGKSACADKTKK
jgi:hypothetical protein